MLFDEDVSSDLVSAPSTSGVVVGSDYASPGIGVGSPQAAASPPERSMVEHIGRGLYNFGAGIEGRPRIDQIEAEEKRKKKHADLEELKGTVTALEHGMSMIQGVEGDERNAFVDSYAKRLDGINPGLGETYKALSKKPDLLTSFKDYAQYLPEPMQVMLKSQPKEFVKFAGTAEGMKTLTEAKDRSDLRMATKKVQTTMIGMQEYVPAEVLKGIMADNTVTASEILSMQQYLPKELQLTEMQLQAVQRNDKVFWQGLGVLHGDKEQELLATRAKGADKTAQPPHVTVDGKVYQWDPDKKLTGTRLATNDKYALLGGNKEPGKGGLDKDVVQTELKLSDDYRQDTKKFAERRPLFESATDYMAKRNDNKTSSGDAALMFAYAKSRDPNDRLAVSETRDLTKLGNIFERFGVSVTGILDKGETLPDRVAKEMYAEIRRTFTEQNKAQAKIEKQYTDKVKAYGGDATRVIGEGLSIKDLDKKPEEKPAAGTGKYKDAGAVRAAFQAGKLTREQAKAELKVFGF